MDLQDKIKVQRIRALTGLNLHLNEWDSIKSYHELDTAIMLSVETYEVQVLVREDRYNKKGTRWIVLMPRSGGGWYIDNDLTAWDPEFQPFIYEKIGRRQTADELIEQREYEKLCYRPGRGRFQLDSYERVCDPIVPSTDKMERHY